MSEWVEDSIRGKKNQLKRRENRLNYRNLNYNKIKTNGMNWIDYMEMRK